MFTSALPGPDPGLTVTASKGVHLVVPWGRLASRDVVTGLITKTATSVLFVIPWHGSHWLIGTTDTAWALDLDHPAASARDISYLLAQVNQVLVDPLTEQDIVGVYARLRPLLAGESETTSKLSREYAVVTPLPGLTVVAGGKYTTYRVMARDTVDVATAGWSVPASCMAEVPLVGAGGYAELWHNRASLADREGLEIARVEVLLHRYGSLIPRAARNDRRPAGPARAAVQRTGLPAGRGAVRRDPRGRAAPRRHPHPADPHLDRDARPRG